MAKPKSMLSYIKFIKNSVILMENLENIQTAIWSDPNYSNRIGEETVLKIFGHPHYTYHPFIGERLPCIFFVTNKDKISYYNLQINNK